MTVEIESRVSGFISHVYRWQMPLLAFAATLVAVYTARKPPEVVTRVVTQDREVVKVEYRDRIVTKQRTKVKAPDGTVTTKTNMVVQEVRERDASTLERTDTRETQAAGTERKSSTSVAALPRRSFGIGYAPVVVGGITTWAPSRFVVTGGLRLADLPLWTTLSVAPGSKLIDTKLSVGLRVDF